MRLVLLALLAGCGGGHRSVATTRAASTPARLEQQCAEAVGPPRVERPADGVFLAIGYDLANTILVTTPAGHVVIDTGMSTARELPARDALLAAAGPAPIAAVIYTHSHIDHVGGASAWVEPQTEVWATDALRDRFFAQYGAFFRAESARGARQYGIHLDHDELPCISIGRQPDLDAAMSPGTVVPTHTFSGRHELVVGGVTFELVEAHGETVDQLFVHLPDRGVLLPGDNWYRAFPNLYTLRGTTPRPVDAWIESLDAMRARDPQVLVPSHTAPVVGRDAVRDALRTYRDGIQWVRDEVVRGALDGRGLDDLVAHVGLPEHLVGAPELAELYGQVDWSARAIYLNHLGWFDGTPEVLYPADDVARRTVDAMGGGEAVLAAAKDALAKDDVRWGLHLLRLLVDARVQLDDVGPLRADALRRLAEGVANTNGRAWLLEAAREIDAGPPVVRAPELPDGLVASVPLSTIFHALPSRLQPGAAMDVVESVRFELGDEAWNVTVRHGVTEIVEGPPLPGTPVPVAVVRAAPEVWRDVALGRRTPVAALAAGDLHIDGDLFAFKAFFDRFERALGGRASPLP